MPMPAESLTPDSPDDVIKGAISETVKMCMAEGGDQKQCVAMAFGMARKMTGKKLGMPGMSMMRAGAEMTGSKMA